MKLGKRLISFLVALFMALSLIPATASAVFASQIDTPSDFTGTVYISYSYDGEFATGKDGKYMAYVPVKLETLASYDFSELSDFDYDADNDGTNELTALKLFYYMLAEYGQGTSEFNISGSPGSAYIAGGMWNYADGTAWTENLNYYYNSMYPLGSEGWGATCDQITLHDGDFIDVAHYSGWDFYSDENAGFQYFAGDEFRTDWAADAITPATIDGAPDYAVHEYEVSAGTPLKVSVMKTISDFNTGGTSYTLFTIPQVYYGAALYEAGAKSVSVSPETGYAEITFSEPGTYYLWTNGTGDSSIVNSPAYAEVVVTANEDPTELADGTYEATGLATAVLSMYHFDEETARVVIKGDDAWLITSIDGKKEANTLKRFDGMAYGPQSKILDPSDETNHTLVEGTAVANVIEVYDDDGVTVVGRTFVLPIPKAIVASGSDIYYMIKYRAGYSDSHDGDWYKASGGDYYLTGYTLKKVSDSTDLPGEEEPEPINLTITNNTGMFKAVTATAVQNADGSATLTFALSGTGYKNLYKGTYEQAVANGTATENWIKGTTNADGKLEFQITIAADELGKDVPVVAVSQSYYEKYLNGQNPLERAFYPRQLKVDLDAATLVTGDYEVTKEIAVTNNISMFRPGTKATLHVVGGPNSNNYAAELILPMTTDSLSEAFIGYPDEAAAAETIKFDTEAKTFTIPVKWVETFGDPTTLVDLCNGEPFTLSTRSASNGNWYGRTATLDETAGTLVFDPFVDPRPANTVDEKIAKIQSQVFTDTTWADCEDAKAAWDALTDEQKALVEEYDYFGLDTGDASLDDPRNQDEIGENEILVVSFGTSFNDSRVATIKAIEDALAEAYPDWSVRRAFTAQIIINHIYARDVEKIDNMDQALARAEANAVKNLVIQPTHLMHGAEYDELVEALEPYQDKMNITIAEPLLGEVGESGTDLNDDKLAVAEAVVSAASVPDDTALVLMGHGTAHPANITYTQMQAAMAELGYNNVFVGTVEGEPEGTDAESTLAKVKAAGYSKVVLRPLMVVAGDHANNDMADPEDEESWYSVFVADEAFSKDTVTCQIAGLGEIPAVQQIYVAHVADVIPTMVEVDFTSQMSGGFLHAPQFAYEVSSNLAESYGYTDSVKGVSVLDVLVAAHELVFEDDFTKETAEDYLEMGRTGAPTTMFGTEGDPSAMYEPSYMGMFFYNHGWPNDGTQNERGEYTGTLFTTQEVKDGDLVEFFFNESGFYADTYTWFTDAEGNYSRVFTVQEDEDLDLVLNGAWIPDPAQLTKDEMDLVNFDRAMDDLDEVQIYIVDLETGNTTEIEDAVTDEGDVTLNFADPGTYTITAYTDEDYMNSYVMTLTTIKVAAAPEDITVTISDKGTVKMAQETVTVIDRNKDGKLDVDEALYAAHEKAYEGGAAAGYATGDSSWGLSIKKLWGDTSGSFGYYLNNASCWSPTDEVSEGDYLSAFVYKDGSTWSDSYAYFGSESYTEDLQASLTVELKKLGWNEDYSQQTEQPAPGATLTLYDSTLTKIGEDKYSVEDKGDGSYTVTIKNGGSYILVATDDDPILVPAVAKVVKQADPADIAVTISDKGTVKMAQETVTVTDRNKDGKLDVDETLYAAHEKAYEGGAAAGYASGESAWGLSVKKLWGDTSGSFGYYLNNASCWSPTDEVSEGDYLSAFVYKDGSTWSDSYAYFGSDSYTEEPQTSLTVELKKLGWNEDYSQQTEQPAPGASLALYDSTFTEIGEDKYSVEDKGDGSYTVTIKNVGSYILVATDDDPILVPAVAKVEVAATFPGLPADYTGVTKSAKGNWYYLKDGELQSDYTGIQNNEYGWWRIENGKVNFDFNGLAANEYGTWYLKGGKVDFNYTGFAAGSIKEGSGWWYVEKGQVTFNKTDVLSGTANTSEDKAGVNGWWYIINSKVYSGDSVAQNAHGWWVIRGGKVDFNYTGFAANAYGWWYAENGQVKFDKNDILQGVAHTDPTAEGEDGWWLVEKSQVVNKTTVAQNKYGWWKVTEGKVDFTFYGLADNQYGWWYLEKGQVIFDYTGFADNQYGWWYVEKGQITFKKNDIVQGKVNNEDGWWLVKKSQVIISDEPTVAQNAYGWWYVIDGKVDFSFNGAAPNEYGVWYIKNGKVDFTFSNTAYGYRFEKGKAVGKA